MESMPTEWLHLYKTGKCKLIYNDKIEISSHLRRGSGRSKKKGLHSGTRKLLGVMDILIILIVVMVSQTRQNFQKCTFYIRVVYLFKYTLMRKMK